jgi:polo-like kinase 4
MELCSRGNLSAFLRSRNEPVLSESELRGVVRSLLDALIYLRKELVLHRDIKAANILVTDDYRVVSHIIGSDSINLMALFCQKLSDFGLSTRLFSLNSTASTFCGSPNYISPHVSFCWSYTLTGLTSISCSEIVARTSYSFPADLWSLGCLMITCLSGTPPFEVG